MERGLLNLVNYGHQDRFRHVIMCLTEAGEFSRQIKSDTCRVIEFHKKPGNDLSLPSQIAQAVRDHGISLLHARGWPTLLETALAARLAGIDATVYGFHGKTVSELAGIGVGRRLAQAVAIRLYKKVVTLNSLMKQDLASEAFLPAKRIDTIWNGVDTKLFVSVSDRRHLKSEYGLPVDRFVVGNIARLDPVKNHGAILRALAAFPPGSTRPFFLLVGDGENRQELERIIANLSLERDVCLWGYSNQTARLLSCMDVFVQSSFYEGFSNTILEAMSVGLPILATDVGGTRDILQEGEEGFFFKPDDSEGLSILLRRLIAEPGLRECLGVRARQRALRDFSIETMVAKYESLYETLALAKSADA